MSSFDSFKSAFKGDIITPSDPDYEKAIARWARNAARRAAIVAYVKDPEDVSLAIKYAKSEKLAIAIRGGGHSPAGASSSEGGLVIDLSRYLNGVRIDAEKKLGYVGGGAIWETVDLEAIKHGLATVGGTVNDTGVGGLTLGGGYGWLSGENGLALDNIVQATIVVADGSVLIASKDQNEDLFWGIRGGGSNFGVCTEFVYKLYDQRRTVYAGVLIFPQSKIKELSKTTMDWWTKGPSGKEGIIQAFTRSPPPENAPTVFTFVFYNDSEEEGRKNFKAFLDLKPIDHTSEIPYEKLNTIQNAVATPGQQAYMRGINQGADRPEVLESTLEKVAELTADGEVQLAAIFEYFPLHTVRSIPADATAYCNRSKEKNLLTIAYWKGTTPEAAKEARDRVYAISDFVAKFEDDSNAAKTQAYGNYGDVLTTPERTALLFGKNYPRLQQIKKKYDPDSVFSKWFPITPA